MIKSTVVRRYGRLRALIGNENEKKEKVGDCGMSHLWENVSGTLHSR